MSAAEVVAAPGTTGAGRRKLIWIGLSILVLIGSLAAIWLFVLAPNAEADDAPIEEGEIVALEPQTTTLGEAQLHHARVALAVVLAEGVDPAIVRPKAPLLQDALLRELATMDADGVRSAAGSDALRARLSTEAQVIWPDDQVARVVLTELLVQ